MAESYANHAQTTLGAAYTAASGVLQVASTTAGSNPGYPFPGTPTFRLVIYDTTTTPATFKGILKVNGITDGTHFAVQAEGPDFNASSGNIAFAILTKGAIDQIKLDILSLVPGGTVHPVNVAVVTPNSLLPWGPIQNTSGLPLYIAATIINGSATFNQVSVFCDNNPTPTTLIMAVDLMGVTGALHPLFFIVLPNQYWSVSSLAVARLFMWTEWL